MWVPAWLARTQSPATPRLEKGNWIAGILAVILMVVFYFYPRSDDSAEIHDSVDQLLIAVYDRLGGPTVGLGLPSDSVLATATADLDRAEQRLAISGTRNARQANLEARVRYLRAHILVQTHQCDEPEGLVRATAELLAALRGAKGRSLRSEVLQLAAVCYHRRAKRFDIASEATGYQPARIYLELSHAAAQAALEYDAENSAALSQAALTLRDAGGDQAAIEKLLLSAVAVPKALGRKQALVTLANHYVSVAPNAQYWDMLAKALAR